jgi:LytS/YehU family sensor histidine kinase
MFDTLLHLSVFSAIVILFGYVLMKIKPIRKNVLSKKPSRNFLILSSLVLGIADMLASELGMDIVGVTANVRDSIAIFAGMLFPPVGIAVGLMGGLYRMSGLFWQGFTGSLGYWTAIPCGIATILAGLVGAYMYKRGYSVSKLTTHKIFIAALVMAVWEIIHVQVITPIVSPLYNADRTFMSVFTLLGEKVLIPMIIANVVAILALLFIIFALKEE